MKHLIKFENFSKEEIEGQISKLNSVIPHAKTRKEAEELQEEIIELEDQLDDLEDDEENEKEED